MHTEFHERGEIDMTAYPEIAWLNAEDVVATGLADVRRGAVLSTPSLRYRTLSAARPARPAVRRPRVRPLPPGRSRARTRTPPPSAEPSG